MVANTVPVSTAFREEAGQRLVVLDVSSLLAESIARLHGGT